MTRKNNFYNLLPTALVLLITSTIFLGSCGRKHHNFLDFSNKKREPKFNRLSLPAVQNLTVKKEGGIVTLRWKKILDAWRLSKYNIYKFIRTAFIPKKPINKIPLTKTHYIDKSKTASNTCYLVRPVFTIKGRQVVGPGSKIVCV